MATKSRFPTRTQRTLPSSSATRASCSWSRALNSRFAWSVTCRSLWSHCRKRSSLPSFESAHLILLSHFPSSAHRQRIFFKYLPHAVGAPASPPRYVHGLALLGDGWPVPTATDAAHPPRVDTYKAVQIRFDSDHALHSFNADMYPLFRSWSSASLAYHHTLLAHARANPTLASHSLRRVPASRLARSTACFN